MSLRALHDVPAPAKINLFLHLVGRRADGYHLLQSLFVLIDWCDRLQFERRDDGRLQRHDLGDALPADDLCLRAARALQSASGSRAGVDISIDKQIPSGAGMGGGSSDAASTLLALNRLWGLRWPRSRLMQIGLTLGADVPFFIGGCNALVEGIGERLTPCTVATQWIAVLKPPSSIETGAIFASPRVNREYRAAILTGFISGGQETSERETSEQETSAVIQALIEAGRNDLQAAAESECAEVSRGLALLADRFGNSAMTGSGSAVFARAGRFDVRLEGGDDDGATIHRSPSPVWSEPTFGPGWRFRMSESLSSHPLRDWAGADG